MDPEYTAYQRSPHAKVGCVSCHIGSGAEWYVKAKLSGLRQVKAVLDGSFSTPIPAPVEHLRPAQDTCEECHWPEKFHGKKVKTFVSYTNDDLENPEVQDIALHIGGRNPLTDNFEGIHWHVSNNVKVQYESLDEKRTSIGGIKVTKPSGVTEEYTIDGAEAENGAGKWRTMDCVDCHNRPTHVYDDLEQRVDLGLYSKKINASIPGIREDSLIRDVTVPAEEVLRFVFPPGVSHAVQNTGGQPPARAAFNTGAHKPAKTDLVMDELIPYPGKIVAEKE
jgi:hypothetical protein